MGCFNWPGTIADDVMIGHVSREYTGYKNDSAQLVMNVRVYQRDGLFETVRHGRSRNPWAIAVSAGVRYRSTSGGLAWGQVRDVMDYVTGYAPGWDAAKVRRLAAIWDRWHLSDMRAGCIHQVPVYRDEIDLGATPRCPVTGYKYGSKWLAEPVPRRVREELTGMF